MIVSLEHNRSRPASSIIAQPLAKQSRGRILARLARAALIAEAQLTPKPALVDERGSGAHDDLTLALLVRSALAIEPFFYEMASLSSDALLDSRLRQQLAKAGRRAEIAMYEATGGSNSHRGAIWCLGLLVSAAAMEQSGATAMNIAETAGRIAALADCHAPEMMSHGLIASRTYGVGGAKAEAQSGFPHVILMGLPLLRSRRVAGASESCCRLDSLLAIMASLDDTCLLHRGGLLALATAKRGAAETIVLGGTASASGMARLFQLDRELLELRASPGGSADLLAATLFLDSLESLNSLDSLECFDSLDTLDTLNALDAVSAASQF